MRRLTRSVDYVQHCTHVQAKQIKLTDPRRREETMAIFITWDCSDIAAHIRKLFNIRDWQKVLVQQTGL
jgi:hypothetical protein